MLFQFMDYFLLVILLCCTVYNLWVNKRLTRASKDYEALVDAKNELSDLLRSTHDFIEKVNSTIEESINMANSNEKTCEAKVSELKSLLEDLRFFSNRSEEVIATLDNFIRLDNSLKRAISRDLSGHASSDPKFVGVKGCKISSGDAFGIGKSFSLQNLFVSDDNHRLSGKSIDLVKQNVGDDAAPRRRSKSAMTAFSGKAADLVMRSGRNYGIGGKKQFVGSRTDGVGSFKSVLMQLAEGI